MLASFLFFDVVAEHSSLSFTGSRPRPSASTTSMGSSSRENPWEPVRWSGMSGFMTNPAPNTGYKPNASNFFSSMDTEHTPIHLPDSHNDFQCQDDATFISTTDPEGLPHSGASSSSKQTASIPQNPCKQMADHVSSRPGLQETGAISDTESVATTILSSKSKGKRDRDTNVVHSLKDRESPKKSSNGKMTQPFKER